MRPARPICATSRKRKEKLQAQLQQVEAEIRGVDKGKCSSPPSASEDTYQSGEADWRPPVKKSTGSVSLPKLLLRIVAQAG